MATETQLLSLGWAAISWIEHYLVHGPGDVQGERVELDDEFAAFIVKAYRVDRHGRRRVRRAFLSRSKGRSKSGLAGFIADFEALGPCRFDHWAEAGEVSDWGYEYEPGEPVGAPLKYAEILCVATEEGQAGNTYDVIHYTLHPETCSPELLADYGRLDVGLTRVNLPNKRGFIEPVTASNESKDGGKSTFIVADETHLWIPPVSGKFKLGKMHQTMVRNLLKRKIASGWMLETSTMYAEGEGSVAEGTHAYAKSLAPGDGKLLFDHRQATDGRDLSTKAERIKALAEAYGPASAWMDLPEIADYWDDPQATHDEFRRFFLNQPVPLEAGILPQWAKLFVDHEPPKPSAIGVSASLDAAFGSIASADRWPDGTTVEMGDELLDLTGAVNVSAVDRRPGTAWLVMEAKRIQVEHGVDVIIDEKCPDGTLIGALEDAGVRVTVMKLTNLVEACSEMVNRVRDRKITHQRTTDLDAAVEVAAWREVGDGRRVFGRKRSSGPVDMLEAATAAMWGALNERTPAIY